MTDRAALLTRIQSAIARKAFAFAAAEVLEEIERDHVLVERGCGVTQAEGLALIAAVRYAMTEPWGYPVEPALDWVIDRVPAMHVHQRGMIADDLRPELARLTANIATRGYWLTLIARLDRAAPDAAPDGP